MIRKITCMACWNDNSPMAYASDPWCSDTCHKEIAGLMKVEQSELSALVFWAAVDEVVLCQSSNPFDDFAFINRDFKKIGNALSDRIAASGAYGKSTPEVSGDGAQPADWTRRALLLSENPWRVEVRELQQPRQ